MTSSTDTDADGAISGLGDVLADAESRRRSIEVYTADADLAAEIAAQFETKNVAVTHEPLPDVDDQGFLILRSAEGEFQGSIGLATLEQVLSPTHHPPWVIAESDVDYGEIFDFLDDTLFTSFDRAQMLATAREIEERAWRVAGGTLYVGFQRAEAFEAQRGIYEELATRGDLAIRAFLDADWAGGAHEDVPTTVSDADEIGDFWFLAFDGDGVDVQKCALVAEERTEGAFYGLWTYDPDAVDDLVAYLEREYLAS